MPKPTSDDDFDEDHTDELPVLVETVALQEAVDLHQPHEDTAQQTAVYSMGEAGIEALTELAQRAEQIPALEAQISVLTDSARDFEQLLAEKARRIAELEAALASSRRSTNDSGAAERHLATQLAVRDARLAELTETVQRLRQEAAASSAEIENLRGVAESARREADTLRRELAAKPASSTTSDSVQALREDHAALVDYIAGRRAWWDEMQAKNASLAARAAALEQELAAGTERLTAAEALAASESSRAVELRAELVDYARRVDELERERHVTRSATAPDQAPPVESEQPEPADFPGLPESAGFPPDYATANVAMKEEAPPMSDAVDGAAPAGETITQLEGEVEYKRQQVAAQLVELRDREQRLRTATSELEGMRGELASIRAELESSRSSIAGLERAVAEKDRAIEARDARIATLHEELKQRATAVDKRGTAELSLDASVDDGLSLPALICLTGDAPKRFALTKKTIMVGRGPQCDLQIVTHTVSREHARLTMNGSVTLIEDLGSRNGVFVNAVRVDRRQLRQGDLVTIGETEFRFIESMAH